MDKIANSLRMSLRGYRVSGVMYHTRLLSTLYLTLLLQRKWKI